MGGAGAGAFETELIHCVAEFLTVLGLVDDLGVGADHLDPVLGEDAHGFQGQGGVQRGLAAHGRQERIGALFLDDLGDYFRGDRLDVGGVGDLRIGHDGGGVRIDQDDAVALGPQGLAGLDAGVVELAGLADDDGAGADDQDGLDVCTFGHRSPQFRSRANGGPRCRVRRVVCLAG